MHKLSIKIINNYAKNSKFKFPFDYYVIEDKDGKILTSSKDKKELKLKLRKGQKKTKKQYAGCPAHNSKPRDDFDL